MPRSRTRIWFVFVATTLVAWTITTALCLVMAHNDDISVVILFYLFWLPFVIAPLVGVFATIALGGRGRDFFPAAGAAVAACWAWVFWLFVASDVKACLGHMLVPSVVMSIAAVLAGAWATKAAP